MGLLKADDWKAQWISYKDESALHKDRAKLFLPPAHYYRKTFTAAKEVRRAMLFGTALGLVDFHLNSERAAQDYFAPGWSDYRQRAYYRAYDVTKSVQKGTNILGAVVADGWYAGYVGYAMLVGYGPDHTGRNIYGKTPALLAQLDIEYADGTHEIVSTDATWETSADGPIREADLLMGESYDARLRQPWTASKASADAAATPAWTWQPAIRAEDNGSTKAHFFEPGVDELREFGFQKPAKLVAYTAPPIRVTQELPAKKVTKHWDGTYIFDFGQNFAGNVRLRITGLAGQKITLRYGEMLHPDGRLMTENLR
jgi:alpha-L-rhamnosidase